MENRLSIIFENLDDKEKTLNTLFATIEYILKHYNQTDTEAVTNCLEEICMFVWGIYFGVLFKIKGFNKDNE